MTIRTHEIDVRDAQVFRRALNAAIDVGVSVLDVEAGDARLGILALKLDRRRRGDVQTTSRGWRAVRGHGDDVVTFAANVQ